MKSKKYILATAMILVLSALLGGCFNSGGTTTSPETTTAPNDGAPYVTTDPMAMPTPGMNATNAPAGTSAPAGSMAPAFDWIAQASSVEGRIGMFSEIQECRIVTSGNTALVGVKFTNAYQGEMTQRIRDMIAGEVMAADSAIQVVAVTSEPKDVEMIYQLSDRQKNGAQPAEMQEEVDKIVRNTTTLR